jgi:acetyl-CoA carboxylase biotin carboxyl carrier protein
MDIKELKALYRFIKDTDIVEAEIEGENGAIRIKRGVPGMEAGQAAPAPLPAPKVEDKAEVKIDENVKVVTSPMVGTFYRAPAPDVDSFVEVGGLVKQGQPLCIIEAMKLMNEVESEFAGRIVSILVENGQPVEYGEPLMHIS